jgi:hypothetical protein
VLTVAVADQQGNVQRQQRVFGVGADGLLADGFE